MEIIEPWRTVITKHQFEDAKLLEEITQEILMCPFLSQSRRTGNVLHEEYTPKTNVVMDGFVKSAVMSYLKDFYKYNCRPHELKSRTWGNVYREGDGLDVHTHPGCILVAVFYLSENNSPLVLTDPRLNACRGHSSEIIRSSFSNQRIIPKAGELYVFPAYLQHFVVASKADLRVSLASDFYLEDND